LIGRTENLERQRRSAAGSLERREHNQIANLGVMDLFKFKPINTVAVFPVLGICLIFCYVP
jgi:hypothetical protein